MSSLLTHLPEFTFATLVHLLLIFVVVLIVNRLLRVAANLMVKPAATATRAAQAREQQTRTLAGVVYSTASKVVWAVALLTAAQEIGINVFPVAALAGLATLALGLGAQNFVRDIFAGFHIILEDQFVVGDTIEAGGTQGRVEHLSLRRTVVRDARGALVTLANGEIRILANLSRDWSQAFVDVALSPNLPQEKVLQLLDAAAAELRNDPAWSQALVDGPRLLGLQSYDQTASTIRLQVRTAPSRQEDVARELRRRIQLEFQRQGVPQYNVQRVELVHPEGAQDSPRPAHSA
jgi:small conductance mechanosensitive channel